MKRKSVVFIVMLVLAAIPATAQHRIGFIGGLNLANVSVDPEDPDTDIANLVAFGVGGVLDLRLAENAVLHVQPLYLQKGAKDGTEGSDAKLKFAYIDVPVMVKVAFGTSTTRPYLMAGPAIGFLLSAKLTGDGEELDLKDFLKSTDFGLNFGGGISFPAGNNSIFVEGRYALGLSNINDDPDDPDTKIKNKGIQFMAGVAFPLGGQ